MEDKLQLPIEHVSYSAMKQFFANRYAFKQNYILKLRNFKDRPSGIAGKAGHIFMENYLISRNADLSMQKAFDYIDNIKDDKVDYGKTGSREKIIQDFTKGVNFLLAELPDVGEVVTTEKEITTYFTLGDTTAPLPIKAITDCITRVNGKLWLWDWKFSQFFSDFEAEKPDYIMQAMFNYHTVKEEYGEAPELINFLEVKNTGNKDGGKQVQIYTIEFAKHPEYFTYFYKLYGGFIEQLIIANEYPDSAFLPNFGDMWTGKESWEDFAAETMDWSMPKQVSHKSLAVDMIQGRETNYVESTVDKVTADTLADQDKIISKLKEFGIPMEFVRCHEGASVTLHLFKPSRGLDMNKIIKHESNLRQALKSKSVRISAPYGDTGLVGIEVANHEQKTVELDNELVITPQQDLIIPVGQDVYGKSYQLDLAKAPHLLVAGATGSGKSVFLNILIHTLTKSHGAEELGLILIDPKQTEFYDFEEVEHLESPVVTDIETIEITLNWLVEEMNDRYKMLRTAKVKNIEQYNETVGAMKRIVVVIDELADIFLSDIGDAMQKCLIKLAQKSRAAGIHLVVATQRPSVDVVTGILKANFPTRIAFMTSSRVDSTVILDQPGAEQLVGNGDLLLMNPREKDLVRLQGYFI